MPKTTIPFHLLAPLASMLALSAMIPDVAVAGVAPPVPIPSTCIATSAADSGVGTVRACYALAATTPGQSWVVYAPNALINLASPITIVPGQQVTLKCIDPVRLPLGSSINDGWKYAYGSGGSYAGITTGLGTVFAGSGFEAIDGNTTPISSGSATYSNWLVDESILHCGFNGFTNAIHFGATNSQGMADGVIAYNTFYHPTNAAIVDENMTGNTFEHNRISAPGVAGEIHEADEVSTGYQPGNFTLEDEFVNHAQSRAAGYEFLATDQDSILSVGAGIGRIQANSNSTPVTMSVTPAASSTAVAVTDLTKFFAGQFVNAGTTADGYTSGREYVVQTVSGSSGAGTITVGTCATPAATVCNPIVATAATAINLTYAGQPNIVAIGANTGLVTQLDLMSLDLENAATGAVSIYGERTVDDFFQAAAQEGSIVLRNSSTFNHFLTTGANSNYDADQGSSLNASPEYRNSDVQYSGFGEFYNFATSTVCQNFNWTRNGSGDCDWVMSFSPATHIQSNLAMGQPSFQSNSNCSSGSLNGYDGVIFIGYSSGCTMVLPTLTSATQTGMPLWLINTSAYPVTVSTDGTQVFNAPGLTSIVVPPGQSVHIQSINAGGSGEGTYGWEVQLSGPLMYGATGTLQTGGHIVNTTATLVSGTVTIALSGAGAFTSATSFVCAVNDNTTPANATVCTKTSGSSVTVTGTGTDSVGVTLIGN